MINLANAFTPTWFFRNYKFAVIIISRCEDASENWMNLFHISVINQLVWLSQSPVSRFLEMQSNRTRKRNGRR